MTKQNIPAGYSIHFVSWENDGDNYQTKIINGLTEADVRFYVDLASRFGSTHSSKKGFGNSEPGEDKLLVLIGEVSARHIDVSTTIKEAIEETLESEEVMDFLEFLGSPSEDYDWGFCRVIESVRVYYYPESVTDVTTKFLEGIKGFSN